MKRRKFLRLTAAAGAGLCLTKAARAQGADGYVPKSKNYMAVHKNAIVIDGAAPMLLSQDFRFGIPARAVYTNWSPVHADSHPGLQQRPLGEPSRRATCEAKLRTAVFS